MPIECRGIVVDAGGVTGELTIYAASQAPHEWRLFCARLLGLPEHRVRVVPRHRRQVRAEGHGPARGHASCSPPSLGAPLKWIEDRRENLLAGGKSRHEQADARLAFDADGTILAADIDFVSDSGATRRRGRSARPPSWACSSRLRTAPVGGAFTAGTMYTNTAGRSAYRGPWQFETLAREVLLDIAARDMGIDPVELRRRNLVRRDELPYANPHGMTYDSISPLETLEQAVAMLDYDAFRAEQAEACAQGRYLGVGLSTYVEPSTPATATTPPRRPPSGSSPPAR